jgi:methyl coenzyme M reductase alpha subunit
MSVCLIPQLPPPAFPKEMQSLLFEQAKSGVVCSRKQAHAVVLDTHTHTHKQVEHFSRYGLLPEVEAEAEEAAAAAAAAATASSAAAAKAAAGGLNVAGPGFGGESD